VVVDNEWTKCCIKPWGNPLSELLFMSSWSDITPFGSQPLPLDGAENFGIGCQFHCQILTASFSASSCCIATHVAIITTHGATSTGLQGAASMWQYASMHSTVWERMVMDGKQPPSLLGSQFWWRKGESSTFVFDVSLCCDQHSRWLLLSCVDHHNMVDQPRI
jgi:hypothetical protein